MEWLKNVYMSQERSEIFLRTRIIQTNFLTISFLPQPLSKLQVRWAELFTHQPQNSNYKAGTNFKAGTKLKAGTKF